MTTRTYEELVTDIAEIVKELIILRAENIQLKERVVFLQQLLLQKEN